MKELEYPFDAKLLIRRKKQLKKKLLSQKGTYVEKKIAVLGGSTTSDVVELIELFLLNNGIRPQFYVSEYNQFYQDSMFKNEKLESFGPDLIYIYTSNRNIEVFPNINDSESDIEIMRANVIDKYVSMWKILENKYHCPIIQNNFEMPLFRLLGNKDIVDVHGRSNFINEINNSFYKYARENKGFYICDLNYISSDFGLRKWQDPFFWYMYGYAMNVSAIPYLSYNVANIIKSIFGKNKKGLVLDLDNTLWGGVIGDDGVDNIQLGHENATCEAYLEFQEYIKSLKELGVLLNIDSKNELENALSGLQHPDSRLTEEDFLEIRANWDPKDKNLLDIAEQIQILPESLVFVDDNPAERQIVTAQIKDVLAPALNKPQEYIQVLDRAGYFEVTDLSEDDKNRNKMYRTNKLRKQQQATFDSYEDYLKSLEMVAWIDQFKPVHMARIAQLTNKSNQFNLTTKRYTQEEIEAAAADQNKITLYGKLSDKYGDNGVVSVVIADLDADECHIELWLMSCRVLKRNMEYAMCDALVQCCRKKNINTLYGYYYPTDKNKMVKNFYKEMGFEKFSEDENGSRWKLNIQEYLMQNKVIAVQGGC